MCTRGTSLVRVQMPMCLLYYMGTLMTQVCKLGANNNMFFFLILLYGIVIMATMEKFKLYSILASCLIY